MTLRAELRAAVRITPRDANAMPPPKPQMLPTNARAKMLDPDLRSLPNKALNVPIAAPIAVGAQTAGVKAGPNEGAVSPETSPFTPASMSFRA